MHGPVTDLLLEKMFAARSVVLVAGAVLIGSAILSCLAEPAFRSFPAVAQALAVVLAIASFGALLIILTSVPFVWYYTYRVGLNEAGLKYAVGHLLICAALTPACLTGIVFIPLLVYYDVERWEQADHCPATREADVR